MADGQQFTSSIYKSTGDYGISHYKILKHKRCKNIPISAQACPTMGFGGPINSPVRIPSAMLKSQIRVNAEQGLQFSKENPFFPWWLLFGVESVDHVLAVGFDQNRSRIQAKVQQVMQG